MGKIIQLSESISNLIAAGEVVENMASVVKELVENAIDAESTTIRIDLLEEGLNEIKVTDDGVGMDKSDMLQSIKRHATSKIKTSHDLFHIGTLGFRGEALPSIASVSHLEMISGDGKKANRLFLLKGVVEDFEEAAPIKGTSVTVRYLFYNTPARLKHLRANTTELSYIVDYVNKIALSHPEIAFTLTNNRNRLFASTGADDVLKVLSNIYSLDIIKNMIPFENKNQYFKIEGFITKPTITRSKRSHVTIIANDRMIKNNLIIKAVTEGYRTYLPIGKYPIVFLKITMDPLLIDVNIHPQKLEVKFTEQRLLISLIQNTIKEKLKKLDLIPQIKMKQDDRPSPHQSQMDFTMKKDPENPVKSTVKEEFNQYITNLKNKKTKTINHRDVKDDSEKESLEIEKPKSKKLPRLEYIGQYLGTYLITQNENGLYLIDQHAAAERVRYENYFKMMEKPKIETYELIIPITLDLSNSEVLALSENIETTKQFGLTIIDNKHNGVDITHVPTWFREGFEREYAEEMIMYILEGKDITIGNVRDELAKSLSCKHSIKANKYINQNEIEKLLRDLEACMNPYTCPHGRPVIIHFTVSEIERMFKRIQS
jgi:DNA mismatch repair protein MutL